MHTFVHEETGIRFQFNADLSGSAVLQSPDGLGGVPRWIPAAALLAFADHARARLAEAHRDDLEAGGEQACAVCGSPGHATPSDWGVCSVCGDPVRGCDGECFYSEKPDGGDSVLTHARCLVDDDDLGAGEPAPRVAPRIPPAAQLAPSFSKRLRDLADRLDGDGSMMDISAGLDKLANEIADSAAAVTAPSPKCPACGSRKLTALRDAEGPGCTAICTVCKHIWAVEPIEAVSILQEFNRAGQRSGVALRKQQ